MEVDRDRFSITVIAANRVELVRKLRAYADNFDGAPAEAVTGKAVASPAKKTAAAPVVDDDDFAAKEEEALGFDDDDTAPEASVEEEPPKKAMKGTKAAAKKKITLDDVNDSCKAHAQANGRAATLGILQKKFKTQSVTALKPEQYEAVISAMAVN